MLRCVLMFFFVFLGSHVAVAESLHKLKGRIIRALAVEAGDPRHILVGHKAGKPGSGLVFQSLDGGKSWRTLNGNRPLAPQASDVQAVAALSKKVLLAGTWKHGLYVSRDGGKRFVRVAEFPSKDIRDLQIVDDKIYAATPNHAVYESADQGRSWQPVGPRVSLFWSLTATDGGLYASSLAKSVHVRRDGRWRPIFSGDKAYATAAAAGLTAIAGETGLHVSEGDGWRKFLEGEKLADVLIVDRDRMIIASWSNGIAVVDRSEQVLKRLLTGKAVVHVQLSGDNVLAGTWGKGLHILPLNEVLP